jgi:hypothetical protein
LLAPKNEMFEIKNETGRWYFRSRLSPVYAALGAAIADLDCRLRETKGAMGEKANERQRPFFA